MIHSDYEILDQNQYYFSHKEWLALVASGTTAALMSISCSLFVILLHTIIILKKNGSASRLSIRMIVISCACNIIYCILQIVSCQILSKSHSCRILVHLIMATDTMACMSLAMIGFNLVVIFIFKVSKSHKVDMCYYTAVLLSGILTFVVPLAMNVRKPGSKIPLSYCWYHYYFEGRMNGLFNWMWYYGWLLLSLAFATFCAAISIRFVIKKQQDLAGTLDMFAQREKADAAMRTLRRYSSTNSFVFLKIARRCVCYPLIPLMSKVWGVSISISAIKKIHIPFSIFILDLVFSCLLGFMVTCVYLTDPAICSFIREIKYQIKKKYVYDYYAIQYRAGVKQDGSRPSKKDNPHTLDLVPLQVDTPENYRNSIRFSLINDQYQQEQLEALASSSHSQSYHPPIVKLKKICGMPATEYNQNNRRYSILTITSTNGDVYLPNQIQSEHSSSSTSTSIPIFESSILHSSVIPMRRKVQRKVIQVISNNSNQPESSRDSLNPSNMIQHTEFVETLETYNYPCLAKCIHWFLADILQVKPMNDEEEQRDSNDPPAPKRVFRDFTNSSNPSLSMSDAAAAAASPKSQRLKKLSENPGSIVKGDNNNNDPSVDDDMAASGHKPQYMNPMPIDSSEFDDIGSAPVTTDYKSRKPTKAIGSASSFSTKYPTDKQQSLVLETPEHSFIDKLRASLPSTSSQRLAKDKDVVSKRASIKHQHKKQTQKQQEIELELKNKYYPPKSIDDTTAETVQKLESNILFSSELSPPPRSHYRQRKQYFERSSSDEVEASKSTEEKSSYDKPKKKKGKEVQSSRSQPTFDDFGFAAGSSRLSYISNWSDEGERVEEQEGRWDVEQDIQDQIELADKLSRKI